MPIATPHMEILSAALPGRPLQRPPKGSGALDEKPYVFWRSDGRTWAVYLPGNGRFSHTALDSMKRCRSAGLEPVVVVCASLDMEAAATHFMGVRPSVACRIAGQCVLITPPASAPTSPPRATRHRTRIPRSTLVRLATQHALPTYLRSAIAKLAQGYKPLSKGGADNDPAECKLLMDFANARLRKMGFSTAQARATRVLRSLEIAGWGSRHDHFFHSFQDYFLGLVPVSRLHTAFTGSQEASGLRWSVDPFAVWFLTTLYHDVGYGVQNLPDILSDTLLCEDEDAVADHTRAEVLKEPLTEEALTQICSLINRLLASSHATTTWAAPSPSTRLSTGERRVAEALEANFMRSHGTASAVDLYKELIPKVGKMQNIWKRDLLRQTVLLACASIPFHDHHFRSSLRDSTGACDVPTDVMPYAATLSFVDSIQDDRRDLAQLTDRIRFLEKIIIKGTCGVSAKINRAAITEEDTLWKIVEARDVLGHLVQKTDVLYFEYPAWMVA